MIKNKLKTTYIFQKFKFEDTCDIDLLIQTRIKQIYELALVIDYRVLMMTIATRKYMEILQSGM